MAGRCIFLFFFHEFSGSLSPSLAVCFFFSRKGMNEPISGSTQKASYASWQISRHWYRSHFNSIRLKKRGTAERERRGVVVQISRNQPIRCLCPSLISIHYFLLFFFFFPAGGCVAVVFFFFSITHPLVKEMRNTIEIEAKKKKKKIDILFCSWLL